MTPATYDGGSTSVSLAPAPETSASNKNIVTRFCVQDVRNPTAEQDAAFYKRVQPERILAPAKTMRRLGTDPAHVACLDNCFADRTLEPRVIKP